MGKAQFRFRKFFACDLLTPQGISGRNFVRGGICTLRIPFGSPDDTTVAKLPQASESPNERNLWADTSVQYGT